jgi:carbamoylphosphate synthase large subunit
LQRDEAMTPVRLLLLAAGTRSARNILATLVGRRGNVVLVGTTSVANEPGPFEFDTVHLVPETASSDFEPTLLGIIDRERIELVIPCRDDDVLMLADLRDRRPDLASRILSGGATAARAACDKAEGHAFSMRHDLPFVPTLVDGTPEARSRFVREQGFPLIVKPRRGFASLGVHLVWNEGQLERAFAQPGTVAQKFLGDPEALARFREAVERDGLPLFHTFQGLRHSIQVLVAPDGTVADVICIQLQSDRRRSKTVVADPEPAARDIGERCGAAFSAAGWRGPLNIQCQKDAAGRLMIHEYNGRFTGATMTRWHLGFDEVGTTIAAFVGRTIGTPLHRRGSAPVEIFEHMETRGANPADVAALARDRVWHRAR